MTINRNQNPNPSPSPSPSPQRQISHQSISRSAIKQKQSYRQMQQHRSNRSNNVHNSKQTKHIIPGVSQMTMRQILSVVFSAFWDRADLYTDVLGLENNQATPRQLKLAFLRQGRVVLATPIESPDDMTLLSAGIRGMINYVGDSDAVSTISIVQAGTPVSRKAKLRFQAVSLAYELLKDGDKRKTYDEWKLWNSRLPPPPPPPPLPSDDHDDNDNHDYGGLRSSNGNVMRSSPGRGGSSDASVISILKNPNAHKRFHRNKRKNQRKSTRTISWNEEVEELTITDQQPPYDPLIDFDAKENAFPTNYHGIPDPYGDSAEDWFGTVDSEMPRYDRNRRSAHAHSRQDRNMNKENKLPSILYAQEANMGFGESTSRSSRSNVDHDIHNFQSLNSQTVMIEDSQQGVVFEGYNPNDSLMMILDGPEDEPQLFQLQPQPQLDTIEIDKKQNESVHESWNGFSNDVNDFANRYNQPDVNNFSNRYIQPDISEKAISQVPAAYTAIATTTTDTPPVKNGRVEPSILPRNPEPGDDDGDSLTSNGNSLDTGSWASLPTIDHQDECDIGRTVDLARGFQASLSNYINAAVDDMKEGLQVIGKQWDELEIVPKGTEAKNFFFLDTSELDAMMGILKTEMDTFSHFTNPNLKVEQEQAPVPVPVPVPAQFPVPASAPELSNKVSPTSSKKKSKRRFGKFFSRS
mmetsp:Transcript_13176/g.19757  ORF Transcript_13176/g.19757 Transcript_13176/m.19757 type:complete len:693 (+) Transcript_13176:142-2220(+)